MNSFTIKDVSCRLHRNSTFFIDDVTHSTFFSLGKKRYYDVINKRVLFRCRRQETSFIVKLFIFLLCTLLMQQSYDKGYKFKYIPKDVKRRELLLPCLAFSSKGKSNVDLALLSGCRAHDQLGKKNFHFRFNLITFGVDFKRLLLLLLLLY